MKNHKIQKKIRSHDLMSEETRVSKIRSLQTSDTGIIRNECEIKKIWKTCIKNNKMRNDQAY